MSIILQFLITTSFGIDDEWLTFVLLPGYMMHDWRCKDSYRCQRGNVCHAMWMVSLRNKVHNSRTRCLINKKNRSKRSQVVFSALSFSQECIIYIPNTRILYRDKKYLRLILIVAFDDRKMIEVFEQY